MSRNASVILLGSGCKNGWTLMLSVWNTRVGPFIRNVLEAWGKRRYRVSCQLNAVLEKEKKMTAASAPVVCAVRC